MYEEDTQSAIIIYGEYSDWFNTTVGSRQGDPLSPKAFIMLPERICDPIKEMGENNGISIHGTKINNLKFADDVDLLATDNKGLQQVLDRVFT